MTSQRAKKLVTRQRVDEGPTPASDGRSSTSAERQGCTFKTLPKKLWALELH